MTGFRGKARALTAAAAVLALLLAAGTVFSPEARRSRESQGSLLVLDPSEIHVLEVSGPEGSLVFRRFGAAWTLEEGGVPLPVRTERIEAYLEALRSVGSLAETSRSESSWEALGLDDGSARRVRLFLRDGVAAADFRVGKYSPDGSRVYLRKGDNPLGLAAPAAVGSRLPSGREAWLDLRVFGEPVPTEDLQSLRIYGTLRFADGADFRADYRLERSLSRGWESPQIPDLDAAAAARLVRSWMGAEAEDFSDEGPPAGTARGLRVELELGGGSLRSLRISGDPDPEGGYLAALAGSGRNLRMDSWTLRGLLKNPEELANRP